MSDDVQKTLRAIYGSEEGETEYKRYLGDSPSKDASKKPPKGYRGNVNLFDRPRVKNSDGTISTIRSMSFSETKGGEEILVPTVSDDGRIMTNKEAIEQYKKTGKHLGKFDTIEEANAEGNRLHKQQESLHVEEPTKEKDSDYVNRVNKLLGGGSSVSFKRATKSPFLRRTKADDIKEAAEEFGPDFIPGTLSEEKMESFQNQWNIQKQFEDKIRDVVESFGGSVQDVREAMGDPDAVDPIGEFVSRNFQRTMKVIEKFQIPQQMLFNSLKRIQQGETNPEEFTAGIVNAIRGSIGKTESEYTMATDLFDGALDELVSSQLLSEKTANTVKESLLYKTGGFITDLAVDPVLWFGMGATRAGKMARIKSMAKKGAQSRKVLPKGGKLKIPKSTAKKLEKEGITLNVGEPAGVHEGIHLDSKFAKDAAKYFNTGVDTGKAIDMIPEIGSLTHRLDTGQMALLTFFGRPVFKGKAILKIGDSLRKKAGRTRAVKTLRRMITNRTGNEAFDEIVFKATQLLKNATDEGVMAGQEIARRLRGVDIEQINLISKTIDEGLDYVVIKNAKKAGTFTKSGKMRMTKDVADVTKDLRTEFRMMKDAEISLGILGAQLEHYFPRIATAPAKKSLEETAKISIMTKSQALKFGRERKTGKFGLHEWNAMMKSKHGIESFFVTDPAVALAIRKTAHNRIMTTTEMLDDLAEKFGTQKGVEIFGIKELKGIKFPKEIADDIDYMYKTLTNPKEMEDFSRAWKVTTDWWKGWTLSIYPEYHARNTVSNFWNNWLAGVKNPNRYIQAHKIFKGMDGSVTTVTGNKYTYDELRKLMKKWGVEGTGLYGADIPEELAQAGLGGGFNTAKQGAKTVAGDIGKAAKADILTKEGLKTVGKTAADLAPLGGRQNSLMKLGFAVGRGIENNARGALFIDQLMKGASPYNAARKVAKYLFDYSDLTTHERAAKLIFPFMKWPKQNIPLQVAELFKQPWKYTMVSKGRAAFFEDREVYQEHFPGLYDYIRENSPWRIRTTKEGDHEYFLFGGWWPGASIQDMFSPFSTVLSLLHPALSAGATLGGPELLAYTSPRTAKELKMDLARETEFLGVPMTKRLQTIFRSFRLLSTANRFTKAMSEKDKEKRKDLLGKALLRTMTGVKTHRVSPKEASYYDTIDKNKFLRESLRNLKEEGFE